MQGLRAGAAALAFAVGAAVHALNAIVSMQERGFVEPFDVPLALALAAAAVFTWRGSIAGLAVGAGASLLALVLIVPSGAAPLIGFWIVVLLLAAQALPVLRAPDASTR